MIICLISTAAEAISMTHTAIYFVERLAAAMASHISWNVKDM